MAPLAGKYDSKIEELGTESVDAVLSKGLLARSASSWDHQVMEGRSAVRPASDTWKSIYPESKLSTPIMKYACVR